MKSVFLIAIVAIAMIGVMVPSVFADYSEIIITPISGSGSSPGCELTDEGCYSPNTAIVDVGGVVIFHNTDSVIHTFTSGIPSDDIIGTEFNTGMLEPDTIAQWTPENVGSFLYFDMIFPWMKGTIIVQEAENRDVSVEETNVSAQAHNACIDDMDTNWKISFTFEMIMDGQPAEVQPNIGITEECQRAIYTLSNDGTVYVEWTENPNFELGHFLYISKFQIRDMEESKTEIYVNDRLAENGLKTPLQDKYHYKAVFITKNYDTSKAAEQRAEAAIRVEEAAIGAAEAEQRAVEQRAAEQRAAEAKAAQDLTNFLIIGGIAIASISLLIILIKRKNKKSNTPQRSITSTSPPPTPSGKTETSTMFFYECPKCHSGDIQNNPDGSVNCPSCGYRG